ncbi:MAG: hypothetical protein AAAFM81_14740, partial [Pseudomonadota bacterium]
SWSENDILQTLDACAEAFTFPMLDNGYVYLAATRLAAFRSADDWHITIEVFGFSPRAGVPDTCVYNFGSNLNNRQRREDFVSADAYNEYLRLNPNNEMQFFMPFDDDDWIDTQDGEVVAANTKSLSVRGQTVYVPDLSHYRESGIDLSRPSEVQIFELCRALAASHRDLVLASKAERERMIPQGAEMLLLLDDWHHPDVIDLDSKPSGNETFQQIARVLTERDPGCYAPTQPSNTHWSNWPDGGLL